MPISYKPLFYTLIRKGLKKTDLKKLADLSATTIAKFAKGESVGLDVIERLCKALECQPNDIFEVVEDKPKGK
ncbi:MAG: helix-turn-helix domain-containing protein [Defluviitaleaceae bacterium]|nr:helix-turn-helix domain-containing protein [Defluviitaleaceae bacterium]